MKLRLKLLKKLFAQLLVFPLFCLVWAGAWLVSVLLAALAPEWDMGTRFGWYRRLEIINGPGRILSPQESVTGQTHDVN